MLGQLQATVFMSLLLLLVAGRSATNTTGLQILDNIPECSIPKIFSGEPVDPASVSLQWKVRRDRNNKIKGYKVLYGADGLMMRSRFYNSSIFDVNRLANVTIPNLRPSTDYIVTIVIIFYNRTGKSRPAIIVTSGKKAPEFKEKQSSGGLIAGLIILAAIAVAVAFGVSIWIIKRRRQKVKKMGPYYISVANVETPHTPTKTLFSRPGYLQVLHSHSQLAEYENPFSIFSEIPLEGQRKSTTSAFPAPKNNRKLVKPYAVVNLDGILPQTAFPTLTGHSSNMEALNQSFGLDRDVQLDRTEDSTAELPSPITISVPVYANVVTSMVVNPSYKRH